VKLQNKLASYNALSKIIIILIFVLLLPFIVNYQAERQTDVRLRQKRDQVLQIIKTEGISQYLVPGQDSSFGSYNLLKEEYISLEQIAPPKQKLNYIGNSPRRVEDKVVDYRILSYTFQASGY